MLATTILAKLNTLSLQVRFNVRNVTDELTYMISCVVLIKQEQRAAFFSKKSDSYFNLLSDSKRNDY